MKEILHKLKVLLNSQVTKNFKLWEILLIIVIPILLFIFGGVIAHIVYYLILFVLFIYYILFMNIPPDTPIS